ncbi:MAG: hypothetical protein EOO94_01845 [Pedobacter sp.]|nr:MAG: hypothetical protein EOO94_01845 [Pedobacter sp.]
MRKLFPLLLLFSLTLGSCKKFIQDQKEKIAMDIITNGTWIIDKYEESSVDMTSSYSGYEFKFNDDETMKAMSVSNTISGTWKPNIVAYTIKNDFPTAGDPIGRLNETWELFDSETDYVKARAKGSSVPKLLYLKKK